MKRIVDYPDELTTKDVAEILRLSPLTILRWRKNGKLPFMKLSYRTLRYKKSDILKMLGE